MKIAIETCDGINIAPPYNLIKNFMVFEVDEGGNHLNIGKNNPSSDLKGNLKYLRNIVRTEDVIRELGDCSTVISHNLNRPLLDQLKDSGVDVFITFRSRIEDAVRQYLKDKIIHENTGGN